MTTVPVSIHVGIVGGGIGGLACAIALRRSGARVTILEQAHELGEIGAGIQITPNVARFLIRWGVDEIIGENLIQCECIRIRDRTGSIVSYTDLRQTVKMYGFPWWVVRRDHLYFGLLEGAKRAGVETHINSRVVKIDHEKDLVQVTTLNGKEHVFDFVVGADGVRSTVRGLLFPDSKPRATTHNAAYRAVLSYEEVFKKVPEARTTLGNTIDVWVGPDAYCITYPMTAGKDLNFVLSHHTKEIQQTVIDADMAELRSTFDDYEPFLQDVIALIPQSQRWPLVMIDPLPCWSSPNKKVVLMGDAAHAMVNHLAQGAATSMEDGIFLGRAMSDVVRGSITLEELVEIYEAKRMPRAWTKQQGSFTFGEIVFIPSKLEEIRNKASLPEYAGSNVTHHEQPKPDYRSWNIWGHANNLPGVWSYDAEGDADNAVCQYLQEHGKVHENTKVADRLRDKWRSWEAIEAKAGGNLNGTDETNSADDIRNKPLA